MGGSMRRGRNRAKARESAEPSVEPAAPAPSEEDAPHASVARSTALMSIATLGSRVTGLVRTWAMAFALGNTFVTSAYQIANTLPNAIYDLVAGGLLGAAFIPVFLLQKEKFGKEGGNRFASNILNLTIVVMGLLSILATVFAPQVVATQTFTVGSDAAVTEYAVLFFQIFAAQIVFYGIGGVVSGVLNANRIYFLPALAPAFNNIAVIVSLFAYVPLSSADPMLAIIVLAVGTTLGVVVQFAIQIPALLKTGFRFTLKIDLRDPALVDAFKIAGPTFVYVVGTLVSFSFRNAFSLQAGADGPATLAYAWTWYQLPYGVLAVSLSRTMFTEMSEAVAREDWKGLRHHVRTGIAGTLLLIIPLAGLMAALATPLMQLFQAGAFGADDASYVASILALWVLTLPFYSVLKYLYNVFASMRKFVAYTVVSLLMIVAQCGLYALLCSPDVLGLAGVPISDLVYYGGCCVIMLAVLFRRIGSFGMGSILWMSARVLAATGLGVAVTLGVSSLLPSGSGMALGLLHLVVCGSIGLVVIFGLCALFRVPEMHVVTNLLDKVLGRLRKRRAPEPQKSAAAKQAVQEQAALPHGKHARIDHALAEGAGEEAPAAPRPTSPAGASAPVLPADTTGAITARARHASPRSADAASERPTAETGRHLRRDEALTMQSSVADAPRSKRARPKTSRTGSGPSEGAPLPPNATGAIMARARHVKK